MAVYERKDSPWFWMLLEGHGRKRERIDIRCDAVSSEVRKKNREAAEAIYHARMTQLARIDAGLPIDSKTTFNAYADWYDENHIAKHRPSSIARERVILEHLRQHFGSMRLPTIKPARWTEYETARRNAGAAVNTIGREFALMKAMLNAAVGEHLDVNPLSSVSRKSEKLPAKRTITATEEKRLLDEIRDPELRDLYIVGVGTLLRQQNLIELQRMQVHGGRIVTGTKTEPHTVNLAGPTHLQRRAGAVLKRRMPKTPHGYFFPTWHERFSRSRESGNAYFLKVVRQAVERADLPWGLKNHGVVWHTMTRASGATRLIRDYGIDVRTVQLMGPWRSLDQMAEYLGVDLSVMAKPAAKRRTA